VLRPWHLLISAIIELNFDMSVPAGMFLVQNTSPQDVTYSKHATVKVPASFGEGKPFEVYIAPGPVTMMVSRIPDEWGPYADGVTVDVRPVGPG